MGIQVCVFEGDGAAPEAVSPVIQALNDLSDIEFVHPPIEEFTDQLHNRIVPTQIEEEIQQADTVFFGAASSTHVPIIRFLRWEYGGGTFANVRPIQYLPGANSPLKEPQGIDYTIVRENLFGLYGGREGPLADLKALYAENDTSTALEDLQPGAYALRVMPEQSLKNVADFSHTLANKFSENGSVTVTSATKSNVLPETDGLFDSIIEDAVVDNTAITFEHLHADDVAHRLVTDPERFDIIVAPNFVGDFLSDLGAGTIGGLGLAPSGCYGADVAYFEPVHGTAPDIVGKDIINPTATLLSAAMMLEYLDKPSLAASITSAIKHTYENGTHLTPDQGGTASTTEFVEVVVSNI